MVAARRAVKEPEASQRSDADRRRRARRAHRAADGPCPTIDPRRGRAAPRVLCPTGRTARIRDPTMSATRRSNPANAAEGSTRGLRICPGDRSRALMITNPSTWASSRTRSKVVLRSTRRARRIQDEANLNAILGRFRPGEAGFDSALKMHKTIRPRTAAGPGRGPVGVSERLLRSGRPSAAPVRAMRDEVRRTPWAGPDARQRARDGGTGAATEEHRKGDRTRANSACSCVPILYQSNGAAGPLRQVRGDASWRPTSRPPADPKT